MKPEEFKKLIKVMVQEELKKQLPSLIPQILSEALTGKQITPNQKSSPVNTQKKMVPPTEQPVKKEYKQYVKNNPWLNDILNETVVKIKPENPYIGYSEPISSTISNDIPITEESTESVETFDYSALNESVTPKTPVVLNIQPKTEEQAKVLNAINRDFRSILKAVDAKKKNGFTPGVGGVSME
jgi:hypothetical protein